MTTPGPIARGALTYLATSVKHLWNQYEQCQANIKGDEVAVHAPCDQVLKVLAEAASIHPGSRYSGSVSARHSFSAQVFQDEQWTEVAQRIQEANEK